MSRETKRDRQARTYNESVNVCFCRTPGLNGTPCYNCQVLSELLAGAEKGERVGAAICDKQFHMYVWNRVEFLAAVQARNVVEARAALLEEIGAGSDGSCPERERAAKWVAEQNPSIWHQTNVEFALTDSAELREEEQLARTLEKQVEELQKKLAAAPAGEQIEGLRGLAHRIRGYADWKVTPFVLEQWANELEAALLAAGGKG